MNMLGMTLRGGLFASLAAAVALTGACSGSGGDGDGGGTCAANLVAGDLVVSEIMANPSGADESNEWWEIYNARTEAVSLDGVELLRSREDGSSPRRHTVASGITLEPGEYFVVGGVLDEAKPGYVDYGYGNDLGDLGNSAGRVAVFCGDALVDEAIYTEASDGASRIFDGGQTPDSVVNDDLSQWCDSTAPFSTGDLGSPGSANENCASSGQSTCLDNGTARDVRPAMPGDVVINEFMPNPSAVGDDVGEWLEIFVANDVDLNGLQIGKDPLDTMDVEFTVASPDCLPATAGSYVVFARGDDPAVNGGLPQVDFVVDFSLSNSSGALWVGRGGSILDEIAYTGSSDGASTQLDPRRQTPADNDDEGNWCASEMPYGDGDSGTPGAANAECELPVPDGQCDEGGTLRALVPPAAGDLVITEFMANPESVGDSDGEWFEVLVNRDVDLNGLELGTESGTVRQTLAQGRCARVTAGSYVVFAREAAAASNGGLPQVDFPLAFALTNSNSSLFVGIGGAELDAITWSSTSSGASRSLDSDSLDTTANDDEMNFCDGVDPYGDGDLGTPGSANPMCGTTGGSDCTDGGTMRPIVRPTAGQLVINEIMPNPAGTEGDNEWFEVLATADVDLNGLEVTRSGSSQSFTVSAPDCIRIASGSVAVFARDMTNNGGLPQVNVVYETVSLVNSNGSLVLNSMGSLVDEVTWPSSSDGVSISLDPAFANATDNDDPTNFCDGMGMYGAGGSGTPGAANPTCGGMMGATCMDGGNPRPIVPPTPGDLVINEIMPSPNGTDGDEEWFEVIANADVDLNGIQISRLPPSSQMFTVSDADCIRVTNGSFVLFAREPDSTTNGGLPAVDVLYGTVSLVGSNGSLVLSDSTGSLLDQVTWTSSSNGSSLNLDPGSATIIGNDTETAFCDGNMMYGSGGNGTPRAANRMCM